MVIKLWPVIQDSVKLQTHLDHSSSLQTTDLLSSMLHYHLPPKDEMKALSFFSLPLFFLLMRLIHTRDSRISQTNSNVTCIIFKGLFLPGGDTSRTPPGGRATLHPAAPPLQSKFLSSLSINLIDCGWNLITCSSEDTPLGRLSPSISFQKVGQRTLKLRGSKFYRELAL